MQELKHIPYMPLELWLRILSFLSPHDLVMFAKSSTTNRTIAADQLLWKRMCQRWFLLFVENLLSLEDVDWRVEFIEQYRRINRPPNSTTGFHRIFLESDVKEFSLVIQQYFNAGHEIPNLRRFLYLAQGAGRSHILVMLYPEMIKKHGEITASIICFYNRRAIALLENSNEKELDAALCNAAYSGNAEVVDFCLRRGDIAKRIAMINQNHLLHYAASGGFLSVVEILLKANVNKNIKNNAGATPLTRACENNHYGIIRLLIQSGGDDISKEFIFSATYGKYNVFKVLLSSSVITNNDKASSLLCLLASWSYGSPKDREKIFTLLLNANVDVNCTDKFGRTPLHHAVKISHSVMRHLIALGAAVNIKDKHGITPLHLAAQHAGQLELEMLLHHGADINAQNRKGRCALHYAVMGKNIAALRCLLSRNADPTIEDAQGDTPLKLAKSLQMSSEIKTSLVALLSEYSLISQCSNTVMFFRKRNADEITHSNGMRREGLPTRDKKTCRYEILHDDPPASDFRTVRMA